MPSPLLLSQDRAEILSQTRAEWAALSNARIFLTGGTGFIGTWLIESFGWARQEFGLHTELTVLTRDPRGFAAREPHLAQLPGLHFLEGDVRNFPFPPGRFTHVIHAATAASAQLNVDAPLVMLDTIVEGTRRVLEFAVHCGAQVVLQTSSGAVYGRQPGELRNVAEEFSGAPDTSEAWSAYGEGKRMAELLGALYAKKAGFDHKVVRIFALVGPRLPLDIHYAMGNFIRDAMRGGPIAIGGDGTPYRSYLYISDLVAWLWAILVRGAPGRAYNAGSDEPYTIEETARAVNAEFGGKAEVTIARRALPGQPGSRYVPSVERIKSELGLAPQVSLPEGIKRTAEWWTAKGVA